MTLRQALQVSVVSLSMLILDAAAEQVAFVARATGAKPDDRPLASGTVQYTIRDIHSTHQRNNDGSEFWDKSIELGGDFTLGVNVTREKQVTGFALVVGRRRTTFPFSWNWFDLLDSDIFKQLKGDAKLRVEVRDVGGLKEVASVEFLDDTTLTFTENMFAHPAGGDTHVVLVKKGSVLRVAP